MARKSLIIIGAGIAGLSAGCYAAMNGYRPRIYEMHTSAGGLCTAWKRGGYTVDGCLQWLVGSKPGSPLYRVWEELGAVQDRQFIYPEEFLRYEAADGRVFRVLCSVDALEDHMREVAPKDGEAIRSFCAGVRQFRPVRPTGPQEKWNRLSIRDLLDRFASPLIRKAISAAWPDSFPAGFLLSTLAWLDDKAAGYPLGGSLPFSRAIEKRFLQLGGELFYSSRVTRILTRSDRAFGVRLEDGSELHADFVISAADGHATIFDWLEGRYVDQTIQGYYEKLTPFPSLVLVALGVNRRFDDVPVLVQSLHIELPGPLPVADSTNRSLGIHLNRDPSLAPPGRTTVQCMFASGYGWWKELRQNAARYSPAKREIADRVTVILDRRFPGFASQVEMRDVATPLTIVRYTGNWNGSFEGWMTTPETWTLRIPKCLPGLRNFLMCGQWVEPGGGLPPSALSGRSAIQLLCAQEGRKFVTAVPS